MRRSFFIFILSIAALSPAPAFAEKDYCSTKNLNRPSLGPARDQVLGTEWCYAYTAADLLSFKLGKKVSAADVKLNHDQWYLTEHPWITKIWGIQQRGYLEPALTSTIEKGVCLEEDFPSDPTKPEGFSIPKGLNIRFLEAEAFVKKMKNLGSKSHQTNRFDAREKSCDSPITPPDELSAGLKISDHLEVVQASNHANALQSYQDKICRKREKLPEQIQPVYWNGDAKSYRDQTKAFNVMNEQLDRENLVAIVYNPSFYLKNNDPSNSHGSTVVGRERDKATGDCMYWIRNSYGNCETLEYKYKCVDGNILVPGTELKKNMFGYGYLK